MDGGRAGLEEELIRLEEKLARLELGNGGAVEATGGSTEERSEGSGATLRYARNSGWRLPVVQACRLTGEIGGCGVW